jgi:hypothetical protein
MVGGSRNGVAVFSRESGYDFRWSDLYCQDLFVRGCSHQFPGGALGKAGPEVSRASLTMQDHDFIVKNGARK